MALNEARWDVQPYYSITDITNNYTKAAIVVTIKSADEFAKQAEQWMKDKAPWEDRSEEERAYVRDVLERKVPDRHAREALRVRMVIPQSAKNHYAKLRREAAKLDLAKLDAMNVRRAGEGLGPLNTLPFKSTNLSRTKQQIRVMIGPVVELEFSHGSDIWYGRWLEIAHQGRWNIVRRAIAEWSPKADAMVKRNANLVQYSITQDSREITEAERFAEFVMREEERTGETYVPWSAEIQATRRRNRMPANRARKEARAFERSGAEQARKLDELTLRKRTEEKYEGPSITFGAGGKVTRR